MLPRIAPALLPWFDRYGRKSLPWQQDPTPYRVWVSEIMLQQTQVTTVVGYFERFMSRFPNVATVASAEADEVLHYWSGLGYYARARNLHRTAQLVARDHSGKFPRTASELESLPGIGRSTAGAIASLAMGQRQPILDGNVKRVLCRYHAIERWWGDAATMRELWQHADRHTPAERVAEYTQAIMDLGATVCVRSRPKCEACPLKTDCLAYSSNLQHAIPARKPKRERPQRFTTFLIVRNSDGQVLLHRRPPRGIWGGLWSFPECDVEENPRDWCKKKLGVAVEAPTPLPTVHHGFTHFDLDILPVVMEASPIGDGTVSSAMEPAKSVWYNASSPPRALGLAAPVTALLEQLQTLPAGQQP